MKNIPYYVPDVCDGHYCPMDCEDGHCPWADEAMEYIANMQESEDDDVIEPSDDDLEMGFDPYMGCYTDDC